MTRPKISTHEAIRSWLFDKALPHWTEHGIDRVHGGFVEQLGLDGRDASLSFKRARVCGRQIYVFCHAQMLGWNDSEKVADRGIDWLTNRAWLGQDKGFARTLSREGEVIDATPDLYDYAFILFAFAWRHRLLKDQESLGWLHRTFDFVERKLRHPATRGYWNELPNRGWRQQNPHMHLTEALIAAYQATGDARFADAVRDLLELFQTRLFDRPNGTLAEYFTDDWQRAPGKDGRLVEPGHLMEWSWILNEARKLIGADTADDIRAALRFAEEHGVDHRTGFTFACVRDDGLCLDKSSRTWANTERIKAAIALYELDEIDPAPVIEQSCGVLFSHFLGRDPPGTWMEVFDENRRGISKTVPASSLYHLMMAFAEVLRIAD